MFSKLKFVVKQQKLYNFLIFKNLFVSIFTNNKKFNNMSIKKLFINKIKN